MVANTKLHLGITVGARSPEVIRVLTAADRIQKGLGQIIIQETVESDYGVESVVRVRVLPSISEFFHSLRPPEQQFK